MFAKSCVTIAVLVAISTSVYANTTRFFSATSCLGSQPADSDVIGRVKEGCTNAFPGPPDFLFAPFCAPDAHVVLPITGNTNATVNYDAITVSYVNSNQGAVITCTVQVQNDVGTVFSSTSLSSAFPTSTPIGGTLSWTGAALPNGGAAIANVRTQSIFCTIPAKFFGVSDNCFSALGQSFITSYSVNTVQP